VPRHPICCVRPNGTIYRVTSAQAGALVAANRAEWSGDKEIRCVGHDSFMPTFDEVRADSSRWVGRKRSPQLSEHKQDFLRAMRRLSI
jgi:hypothetical protein